MMALRVGWVSEVDMGGGWSTLTSRRSIIIGWEDGPICLNIGSGRTFGVLDTLPRLWLEISNLPSLHGNCEFQKKFNGGEARGGV